MTTETTLVSPRLFTLQREIEAGDDAALSTFWQEVSQQGTPLIESIEGEDKYVLITFLFRAPADSQNVSVVGALGGRGWISEPMTCLPNTDVWYKTYRARHDVRTDYRLALDGVEQPDPLNPKSQVFPADEESYFSKGMITSVLELPAAPPQVWISRRSGVVSGQVERHRLRSHILDNERRIWVYTPPGYTPESGPYALLILFDRWIYPEIIPAPIILDNLIASDSMPPLVAIMISCINMETRNREFPCNPSFTDFLAQELMPWVRQHYHVTADPAQTIVGGASFGGLAAAYAGLRRSEIFGKVLCQSGSFLLKPKDDVEYEWLTRQYVVSPHVPLSFYLEAGLLETDTDAGDEPSLLVASRHMRDVLQAKGYAVHYAEYSGGHNFVCWQGSLADSLLALIGRGKVAS